MRIALVSVAFALLGCTADFSTFEPVPGDASEIDSSSAEDTSVAADSSTPSDTGTAPVDTGTAPVDTGTTPVDTGTTPVDTGTPDTAKPDTGVPCTEPESKTLAGHCYFPINSARWNNASSSCTSKGAHLVSITSATEETLVESIRPGKERWIGLSRPPSAPPTEASFGWVTMEAVSYKKWGMGEPNGSGECVRLNAGNSWADQNCNTNYDAICERE